MTLLPTAEITAMRATAEQTMDGTAVIQTLSTVSDGGGGDTSTWTASGTVACHLSPITGDESVHGGRISPDANWVTTLPALTSITRAARVVIAGSTYEVVGLRAPRTWELTRRAELKELL
jgi:head-tail adaptor